MGALTPRGAPPSPSPNARDRELQGEDDGRDSGYDAARRLRDLQRHDLLSNGDEGDLEDDVDVWFAVGRVRADQLDALDADEDEDEEE